jgi:hypothetical protein
VMSKPFNFSHIVFFFFNYVFRLYISVVACNFCCCKDKLLAVTDLKHQITQSRRAVV